MADIKHAGYKATAQTIAWTSGQAFNSLVDDEWTDLSDEIDNTTNLYLMADVYLDMGSAAFTGADSEIAIYLVPTVDGTNYATWTGGGTSAEQENEQHFVGAVTTTGTTAAQDLIYRNVLLPPGKFKWAFRNRSGVTLNASNTCYYRPHQPQVV